MRLTFEQDRLTLRRAIKVTQWAVPGALLALMPKCPMCLAGYVALWTGIGLSLPAVAGVRVALIAASAGVLVFLVIRELRRIGKTCPRCEPFSPNE